MQQIELNDIFLEHLKDKQYRTKRKYNQRRGYVFGVFHTYKVVDP